MTLLDSTMQVLHLLFAAVWAGGTLVMVGLVLPTARDGHLTEDGLRRVLKGFSYATMGSVAVMFITGGHLAGTRYTFDTLQGSSRGHLVLTMLVGWFVLAGLLHFATRGLMDGLDSESVETAVSESMTWFNASAVVALLVLVIAGLL